jgi:hypothetical protein
MRLRCGRYFPYYYFAMAYGAPLFFAASEEGVQLPGPPIRVTREEARLEEVVCVSVRPSVVSPEGSRNGSQQPYMHWAVRRCRGGGVELMFLGGACIFRASGHLVSTVRG